MADGAIRGTPAPKVAPPPARGAKETAATTPTKSSAATKESKAGKRVDADTFEASKTPAAVPSEVREALTTSWCDFRVGESDVNQVHRSLEGLTAPAYQAALGQLDREGLLDSYLGAMDVKQRSAFLDQAMRKGAIGGWADEKPKGPFQPPAPPRLYVQSPTLAPALREAVHQGNLELARGYNREYGEYVDRYAEAVMGQSDAAAIRRLGPPSPLAALEEPGLEKSNPDFVKFNDDWADLARYAPTGNKAWDAISNRMDDLTGEVRPGSYWLQLEAEVVRKDGAVIRGTGIDLTARDYGQVEIAGKKSLGVQGGGKAFEGSLKAEVKGGVKLQPGNHPHLEKEAEVKGSAKVGVPHGPSVGVEVGTTGTRELSLNLDEHLGSYAKANPREAKLEGGVKLKVELGKTTELEGKVGFGIKGITEETVANALDPENPGFFAVPPERANRVPWAELSERAQARYRAHGYDEANWRNW